MSELLKNNLENLSEINEWDELGAAVPFAGEEEKIDINVIMDSVEVPDITLEDDTPTSETSSEYIATNQEIFQKIIGQINQDLSMLEGNGASPETKRDLQESYDTIVEAYAETQIADDETPKSLISVLEDRKSVYDKKAAIYEDLLDKPMVNQNLRRSEQTSNLIIMAQNVKEGIENSKNPNSSYNQYAALFK